MSWDLHTDKPRSAHTFQICQNRPRNLWRPLMCVNSEALVSTFKHFTPISSSFDPISFEASHCESLNFIQMALAVEEESVGLLSSFTGVVHLTAYWKCVRLWSRAEWDTSTHPTLRNRPVSFHMLFLLRLTHAVWSLCSLFPFPPHAHWLRAHSSGGFQAHRLLHFALVARWLCFSLRLQTVRGQSCGEGV